MVETTSACGAVKKDATLKNVDAVWDDWYVKGLSDFIRIPNLTPMVDDEFLTNGLIQKAMDLVDDYIGKIGL